MNVFYSVVDYGRGEMRLKVLVAARTKKEAMKVAREAAPVPCHDNQVECALIEDLCFIGQTPCVIRKM